MNQAQALKNLIENGISIEYFNDRYFMIAKEKTKVYEVGKKQPKTLTQAQQTKLLMQARGGGQTKPKRSAKRQIANDFDDDVDDEFQQSEYSRRDQVQTSQKYSDDEDIEQTITEKPAKPPKPTPEKAKTNRKQITLYHKLILKNQYRQPQTPPQAENPQLQDEIPEIRFNETDL
ncbi:MAG: hypothetical protein EZS28_000118 [Streblomastix strix]|uniref:Uncharacterized protein n=1 Tax=Streblomastix strix TaxID=222440 RepID=A0A5J4XCV4_9EUKA|nr:MAG: hypothetical protein EZS28_000118 [Streblomastix strix]